MTNRTHLSLLMSTKMFYSRPIQVKKKPKPVVVYKPLKNKI